MIVILVHWLIRPGREDTFLATWKRMSVEKGRGLYREILTKPSQHENPLFNTFSITDTSYLTFINIGMWKSVKEFDEAIREYLPPVYDVKHPKTKEDKKAIGIEDFEFKIRERIVLEVIEDRDGGESFPPTSL